MIVMQRFQRVAFVLLVVLAVGLSGFQVVSAQEDAPFDLFGDSINNRLIYQYLESKGKAQIELQPEDAVASIVEQLESATRSSDVKIDSLTNAGAVSKDELYEHMVKSSLFFGELYDCGRCDRTHMSYSGAVAISEDGLILTNHHVLESRGQNNTEGYMAMAWDGRCFAIEKIVAADKTADIALVQLKADGYKFHAAPIASSRPTPMDPVRVISHPSGEFFVLTQGEVSRYSQMKDRVWMEITADFAGGSSGSGVFNDSGEVVGIVSRIQTIMRDPRKAIGGNAKRKRNAQPYVEMILKRCVPLKAIQDSFAKQD